MLLQVTATDLSKEALGYGQWGLLFAALVAGAAVVFFYFKEQINKDREDAGKNRDQMSMVMQWFMKKIDRDDDAKDNLVRESLIIGFKKENLNGSNNDSHRKNGGSNIQ